MTIALHRDRFAKVNHRRNSPNHTSPKAGHQFLYPIQLYSADPFGEAPTVLESIPEVPSPTSSVEANRRSSRWQRVPSWRSPTASETFPTTPASQQSAGSPASSSSSSSSKRIPIKSAEPVSARTRYKRQTRRRTFMAGLIGGTVGMVLLGPLGGVVGGMGAAVVTKRTRKWREYQHFGVPLHKRQKQQEEKEAQKSAALDHEHCACHEAVLT